MLGEFKIEEKNLQCEERKLNPRGKIIIHTVKAIREGHCLEVYVLLYVFIERGLSFLSSYLAPTITATIATALLTMYVHSASKCSSMLAIKGSGGGAESITRQQKRW
jgi:hypothetical protein